MLCGECGGKTRVTLSVKDGEVVLRQRECAKCGKRFFTEERVNNSIILRSKIYGLRHERYC